MNEQRPSKEQVERPYWVPDNALCRMIRECEQSPDALHSLQAHVLKGICADLLDHRTAPEPPPASNTLSSPRSALWRHMHDEHGLTLLESELDEIELLAKACSADEPESGPMAPIACIRVGEDDTCEVLHLYAPGLPPGEHDVYPAAPSQPPRALPEPPASLGEILEWIHSMSDDAPVKNMARTALDKWEAIQARASQPPELPRVTPEQFIENVANLSDTPWGAPQPSSEDVRDAERYRLLRGGNDYQRGGPMVVLCEQNHIDSDDRPFWSLAGEALDSEVDRLGIARYTEKDVEAIVAAALAARAARASQPPGAGWRSVAVDPPPPTMHDRVVLVFTGYAYSAEYADDVNPQDHVMWLEFPLVRTHPTKEV